ncbi:zinc ribbon domain-containing protein [Nocardioides sp. T2.26MG-1]|uniref:zinc ribbon domain-containing protein n=1 Tax=Nocardioides sp. T2.26MG-1 TaxID=3041166 RepID=UPI0024777217|nr:zinc ribbon domain-containing protein [Nocardioides sp. T2.26MG-1]CAI9399453.1 hypothetical protein HIDPHFAB_00199 [Nocardioides sp. T2.26MG-1]
MATAAPGFARQGQYRTTFRVLGALLVVAGIVMGIYGFSAVFGSDEVPGALALLCFVGSVLVFGVGLMFLQWGFLGAAARYGAGETMPVVKDSAEYLSNGEGLLGVGRSAGPFCSKCGVRNDGDAKFCDSCGSALA